MKPADPFLAAASTAHGVAQVDSLVILGSSVTALAVVREAHDLGLACVLADTTRGIAMSSRYPQSVVLGDRDDTTTLERLTALATKRAAILPTEDRWLHFLSTHRAALDAAYARVLAPSNAALQLCLDKAAFARWCVEAGLPSPRSWPLDDPDIVLPVLIRPARTLHDRGDLALPKAVVVRSASDLALWRGRFRAAGIEALASESLLDRDVAQYSVPFARKDGNTVSFVARKVRPPAEWARTGTCVELCPNAAVERLALAAIERLDCTGIGEVEILRCGDGTCHLVEINARPWVQYALATRSGHGFLAFLLGSPSKRTPRKTAIRWLSLRADLYACFSRSEGLVTQGRLSVRSWLLSVLTANAFAYFTWRDPLPAFKDATALLADLVARLSRRAFRFVPPPMVKP